MGRVGFESRRTRASVACWNVSGLSHEGHMQVRHAGECDLKLVVEKPVYHIYHYTATGSTRPKPEGPRVHTFFAKLHSSSSAVLVGSRKHSDLTITEDVKVMYTVSDKLASEAKDISKMTCYCQDFPNFLLVHQQESGASWTSWQVKL
ncbi:hypothetical protein EDB86DRAFT_2828253 [Lactarius hatsudake]|nr:hypothetical protein EDB86DRAFT_2828253 [Lactarius hatsudake]